MCHIDKHHLFCWFVTKNNVSSFIYYLLLVYVFGWESSINLQNQPVVFLTDLKTEISIPPPSFWLVFYESYWYLFVPPIHNRASYWWFMIFISYFTHYRQLILLVQFVVTLNFYGKWRNKLLLSVIIIIMNLSRWTSTLLLPSHTKQHMFSLLGYFIPLFFWEIVCRM